MFLTETKTCLTEAGAEDTRILDPGTLLLTNSGATLGVPKITKIKAGANDGIAALLFPQADKQFLYYFLQSRTSYFRGGLAPGVGQPNLNTELIGSVPVMLPPLPEQQKIAEILGKWDEALEKLNALISAKERRKKALMQQLLTGKKRVKGCSEPWVNCKLGQLFNDRVEQGRCDLPLLSITANRGVVPRGDLAKRDTSSEDKSKYLRIVPGDIGYNTMRMWQGVSALSSMEGIVSPAYTVCTPTELIDGRFAAHFLKLPHTIHLLHRYSQGLVDDTLNLKFPSFAVIEVTIPSDLKEQRVITEILDCCDEELRLLRTERDGLDQQKRGLMQRLLTGKVRVKL
jgi:type I restriction enzyme S subunit